MATLPYWLGQHDFYGRWQASRTAALMLEFQDHAFRCHLFRHEPASKLHDQALRTGEMQLGVFDPSEQFQFRLERLGGNHPFKEFRGGTERLVKNIE